jgi:aminoglycoside phosphotransferase (APT) family kinase protein
MGRELRILSALAPVWPRAPRPIVGCDDVSVIGAPFYAMERVRGIVIRRSAPKGMTLAPETLRALAFALVDGLAELHAVDWKKAGLDGLGKPDGYVARQVTGWTKRWQDSKTEEVADVDAVSAWLAAHMPGERGAVLVHNDYKLDNVVLDASDPTRIVGVLDWEMSTIGDPLMDLGVTLGYWIEKDDDPRLLALSFGPTAGPGAPTRAELAARYAERTGRDVGGIRWYHVFALFKLGVVLQQIYARWVAGKTKDERFAMLGMAVKVLAENARREID